ncbi:hypothetical protein AVEN_46899-1 [Araneus ventricosus]|uniref:Uncharacterized protein n=1 Tax=Araneus ventricosus TaxID=182803 RepID=A0A4Y2CNP9_ARAVE|nr:hypothetical protein AVEN_46899-1 [Araneus ventricosus]
MSCLRVLLTQHYMSSFRCSAWYVAETELVSFPLPIVLTPLFYLQSTPGPLSSQSKSLLILQIVSPDCGRRTLTDAVI